MISRTAKLVIGAIVAVALVLGGASVAAAYWTAGGSGTGQAATGSGTTASLTLSPGTPVAALKPGSTSSVVVVVANANTATVKINTLSIDTSHGTAGFSVDSSHTGCTLSTLSYTSQSNGGAGWTVPAKAGSTNGTLTITLAGAIAMSATAPNACQGATFTVYLLAA